MTTTTQLPETDQDTINLFEVGCLVNLRVGTWSGRKMLTRKDMEDVGVNPDALPEDLVSLGRKLLVPKEEIDAITHVEQRARKLLDKWSVPFGIANSHFVPISKLPSVEGELLSLQKEFFEKVDKFIVNFAQSKEKIRNQHPDFWNKCLQQCYPATPKLLREKFKFNWMLFKIAGIGAIQESTIDEIMVSAEVRKEKANELRKQMSEEVSDFVEEYVKTMRAEAVEFCKLMSARVSGQPYGDEEEAKKLTPRSISMFRKKVDRFKQMNIFGDNEIEKMLNEFNESFLSEGTTPTDFDSDHMKSSVSESLAAIRKKAAEDGESTSKFIGQLKRKVVI